MNEIIVKQKMEYISLLEEKHNIIFLDIDGVLNTDFSKERTPCGFVGINRHKVSILKEIVDENNAKIVLISDWKDMWNEWTKDPDAIYLQKVLAQYDLYIASRTYDHVYDRGAGILNWLKEYKHNGFVVLDDEKFDYKKVGLVPYWIRTGFGINGGLKEKHIKMANRIFLKSKDTRIVFDS